MRVLDLDPFLAKNRRNWLFWGFRCNVYVEKTMIFGKNGKFDPFWVKKGQKHGIITFESNPTRKGPF